MHLLLVLLDYASSFRRLLDAPLVSGRDDEYTRDSSLVAVCFALCHQSHIYAKKNIAESEEVSQKNGNLP